MFIFYCLFSLEFPVSHNMRAAKPLGFFPMFCFTSKKHLLCCWNQKCHMISQVLLKNSNEALPLRLGCAAICFWCLWVFFSTQIIPCLIGVFHYFHHPFWGVPPLIFGNIHILFLEHCDVDFVLLKWSNGSQEHKKHVIHTTQHGHSKLAGLIEMS